MNEILVAIIGASWLIIGILVAMVIGKSEKDFEEQDKQLEEHFLREKFDRESV